jgi:hypothetical protein
VMPDKYFSMMFTIPIRNYVYAFAKCVAILQVLQFLNQYKERL